MIFYSQLVLPLLERRSTSILWSSFFTKLMRNTLDLVLNWTFPSKVLAFLCTFSWSSKTSNNTKGKEKKALEYFDKNWRDITWQQPIFAIRIIWVSQILQITYRNCRSIASMSTICSSFHFKCFYWSQQIKQFVFDPIFIFYIEFSELDTKKYREKKTGKTGELNAWNWKYLAMTENWNLGEVTMVMNCSSVSRLFRWKNKNTKLNQSVRKWSKRSTKKERKWVPTMQCSSCKHRPLTAYTAFGIEHFIIS